MLDSEIEMRESNQSLKSEIDLSSNKDNIIIEAINFFASDYLKPLNAKALIMIKDFYTPYSIILRKSVTIFNSLNFELINEVRNIPDNFPLDDPEKIVLFQYSKINYMLIYSEKIFAIFNLNLRDLNNYVIFQISELEENERIINIKPLNNDLKLPYFILVTSSLNVHILSLLNLSPQANFLNDTYFETIKLNENQGIFKKLTSYLLTSRQTVESDNIFILNSSNSGLLYKNNTKIENSIFLFNENCLKIIEFYFINNRLRAEISLQLNIANIIHDRIKAYNERFSKTQLNQLTIEDADIFYDKNHNLFNIYAIAKLNEYFYIIRIRVESSYRVIAEVLEDINNLKIEEIQNLYNKVEKAKIFLNKNLNEFYTIFSTNEKSFIFFFSSKVEGKGMAYKKASLPIDGVSTNFIGNKSYLNILFNKNVVLEILFDVKGNNLIFRDISNTFYKGIMIKSSFVKPIQNKMLDFSIQDNRSEISGSLDRQGKSLNGEDYSPSNNLRDINLNYIGDLDGGNTYSEFNELDKRVLFSFTNKLRKYYDYKMGTKEADLNAIYDINLDIEELTHYLNSINKENDTIQKAIKNIILNIVDNESLNINNINMDTKKSEYIIIEYLKERAEKYEIFLSFLKDYKIFENFDYNKELYPLCNSYYEKLNSAIKIREQENFLLKNFNGERDIEKIINSEQKLINSSYKFYDECFKKHKQIKETKVSKNINKYTVYLKISNFDDYLEFVLDKYLQELNDINKKKEHNLYVAFNIINLWNLIFGEIKRISYPEEFANNQYDIHGTTELNMDYRYTYNAAYYENFDNFHSSLWLVEKKEKFLEKLEKIFIFLVEDDKNEFSSFRKNMSGFSRSVVDFVDNMIFFYRMHHNYKSSSEYKKVDFEKKKRILIKRIINFDYEKSLKISIKYQSLYYIAFICNLYKCPEKLKEYFNTMHNTVEGGKMIEYMLKVYLFLDMKKKISYDKLNILELTNEYNYDDFIINFDFFDIFGEYHAQLINVVVNYPKLNFYYELYLKTREGALDRHTNVEKSNWENFLNIDDLINCFNKNYNLENTLKMIRYILNINFINYEENRINRQETNNMLINNEINMNDDAIDISDQENIERKISKLKYFMQKTNFYYMLFNFNKINGFLTEKSQKFLAGSGNVYENLKDICLKIEREFNGEINKRNYDYKKLINGFGDKIKILLNLISYFKFTFVIEDENDLKSISELIMLENEYDEKLSNFKDLSIFKKLKDSRCFDYETLENLEHIEKLKDLLKNNLPDINERFKDGFLQFLNSL